MYMAETKKQALTAYEEFAPGEQIGHLARGLKVTDLSTQPIGEMMFHDDFSRPPGEPDPWDIAEGSWAIRLPESRNAVSDPVKTANQQRRINLSLIHISEPTRPY